MAYLSIDQIAEYVEKAKKKSGEEFAAGEPFTIEFPQDPLFSNTPDGDEPLANKVLRLRSFKQNVTIHLDPLGRVERLEVSPR